MGNARPRAGRGRTGGPGSRSCGRSTAHPASGGWQTDAPASDNADRRCFIKKIMLGRLGPVVSDVGRFRPSWGAARPFGGG